MTALFTTSLGGHNELTLKWKSSAGTYFASSHLDTACWLDLQAFFNVAWSEATGYRSVASCLYDLRSRNAPAHSAAWINDSACSTSCMGSCAGPCVCLLWNR